MRRRFALLALALAALSLAPVPRAAGQQPIFPTRNQPAVPGKGKPPSDEALLESAGLKAADAGELLGYMRQRTLSDADLGKIQAVIDRMGGEDFEERLKATREVEKFGPAAVGPLKKASVPDPAGGASVNYEAAYRAGVALKRLEKVPHESDSAAIVRTLAKNPPSGEATRVMLNFLPVADSPAVTELIREALQKHAVRDGKAEPVLVEALASDSAAKRAAAGVALIVGGPSKERVRVPDAIDAARAAAKKEADIDARFQMLFALATVPGDADALTQIIEALPMLPRGRLWQAEDLLMQLAGADAPKATFGKSDEPLKLKEAAAKWAAWWAKAGATRDLAKYDYKPRIRGRMLVVLADHGQSNPGHVAELGPDFKERWRVGGLMTPNDALFLPDGTLAVAEQGSQFVSVRNPATGELLAQKMISSPKAQLYGNPHQLQLLPDGGLMVVCRSAIVDFKKPAAAKEEPALVFNRNMNHDIAAALRLPNGETLAYLQYGTASCVFLDKAGKEIEGRTLKVGQAYNQAHIQAVGDDRVLLTEYNQVAEYSLKDGKLVWKYAVQQPRFVQRLPNGNTLVIEAGPNRLIEVSPEGEVVWDYKYPGTMTLCKAYRY